MIRLGPARVRCWLSYRALALADVRIRKCRLVARTARGARRVIVERLAQRAIELGKDDAVALGCGGFTLAFLGRDLVGGAAFIEWALVLNPNLAATWFFSGYVKIFLGEPEAAIERFAHAMRLSPLDPNFAAMKAVTGLAHFFAARYDDASSWAEEAILEWPSRQSLALFRVAAPSNALGGRLEKAQQAMARLRQLDPTFRGSNLTDRVLLRRPEDIARLTEGLRIAGLPELPSPTAWPRYGIEPPPANLAHRDCSRVSFLHYSNTILGFMGGF